MSKFSFKIFLPAAGLGERLRPITNHMPKPLLPLLGKPLIEIILKKFSDISSGKIGINLHYKPEAIRKWADESEYKDRIELFPEDPILGTGGALKNAEIFLSDSYFMVHNADIVSDIDFIKLVMTHIISGNIATLATHNYPKYSNVIVNDKGLVIDVENPGTSMPNPSTDRFKTAYTGIAVYSPEIFQFLPSGESHATSAWIEASKAGKKVQALDFTGCCWSDVGTPMSYASAIIKNLRSEGETTYFHPSAKKIDNLEIDGYVIIEKENTFNKKISVRNCIVLPESGLDQNTYYENCIIGHDFKIDLNEADLLGTKNNGILIGTGGSNREYFRVEKNYKTFVVMKCKNSDSDYTRHIEYTKFFLKHLVPVPELVDYEPDKMLATFEDLGDVSLYTWLKKTHDDKTIEQMYRKVLDILILIHTEATARVAECPLLQNKIFDYEHYRWETSYFIEQLVKNIKEISIKNTSSLNDEFHNLAAKAVSFHKTIIHRDFQSQNIMIHNGIPRLIDFQSARIGLPAYDIASILWDPYYRLEDKTRKNLLKYYAAQIKAKDAFFDKDKFEESLIICRLQRHMQALGAFGFLSSSAGKRYFSKYIPKGIKLLKEDIFLVKDEYPELYKLIAVL
ncbi:MAG: phosphotransferase [Nitrospiraceae bacterium]|nr:phosphotransferase [Nitrospiraceae bacterium]